MFSVYGKSRIVAKKTAYKHMEAGLNIICITLNNVESSNQEVKQNIIDDYIDKLFKEMKPKRCTHEFSTPEIMNIVFNLMEKDKYNFSDLVKMKKQVKINANGCERKSKTTGKLMLEWVTFK